jgi:hypothetical protein
VTDFHPIFSARRTTLCTIRIEHSESSLHAHVELDGEGDLRPGDKVRVLGSPIRVAFGECVELRREAVVRRAGLLGRQLTRVMARFQFAELYEVTFTPGALAAPKAPRARSTSPRGRVGRRPIPVGLPGLAVQPSGRV